MFIIHSDSLVTWFNSKRNSFLLIYAIDFSSNTPKTKRRNLDFVSTVDPTAEPASSAVSAPQNCLNRLHWVISIKIT